MKKYHVTLISYKLLQVLEYDIQADDETSAIKKAMMKARKLDEIGGDTYDFHKIEEI